MSMRYSPPVGGFRAGKGLIDKIGGLFGLKGKDNDENHGGVIDTDEDGKSLFKEDIIQKVMDELTLRKTERQTLEQKWTLNANFLVGNQYCEINPYRF